MTFKLTFNPYDITIEVPEGENLLRAASDAGIHINASCGGEGVCGKCRVLLESGELDTARSGLLSDEAWNTGLSPGMPVPHHVRCGSPRPA